MLSINRISKFMYNFDSFAKENGTYSFWFTLHKYKVIRKNWYKNKMTFKIKSYYPKVGEVDKTI